MFALVAFVCTAAVSAQGSTAASPQDYYFLVLEGQGMPVKQIILNGTNVLGGSVVSQSIPINVTQELKAGKNELELDMVSHPTDNFTTIVQKRTDGPKIAEITRIAVNADENRGSVIHKAITFNIDSPPSQDKIESISDSDKEKIGALVADYHRTLKDKNISKFRKLYQPALKREYKIFPEGAKFFEKVLDREIALLKNPKIEVGAFESNGMVIEPDGDKIKVCRKGANQPLLESNEIEVESEPLFVELEGKKEKKARNAEGDAKPTAKQRLVTTKLLFRKIDGDWQLALPQGS
jgi:hypothetical protein